MTHEPARMESDDVESADVESVVVEAVRVPAADGVPLAGHLFLPSRDAGRLVTIHPATAVHQRIYGHYARFLAARGSVVLTFDWRGTGASLDGHPRTVSARMRDWGELDLDGVLEWSGARFPEHRRLCVAHSVGGQVLGLTPRCARLERVLGIASQWGRWDLWPAPRRWLYLALFHAAPAAIALSGYFPGRLIGMGDLPAGVGAEWMRWCRSRAYVSDDDGSPLRPHYGALRAHCRWVGFRDDVAFAPPAAVAHMACVYPNARSRVDIVDPRAEGLPPVGHFGFFRRRLRATLWPRLAAWLEADDEHDAAQTATAT